MAFDETLAARIRQALIGEDDVVEKRMFGGVAFMVRDRMACGILGDSLMARIDPADAECLLGEPHVRPMDFTGRPMKGLVFVDPPAIDTPRRLRAWVDRCIAASAARPAATRSGKKRPTTAKRTASARPRRGVRTKG